MTADASDDRAAPRPIVRNPYPELLRMRAQRTADALLGCLTPVYREGIHRPEPVGSGLLVQLGGLTFLMTAAHVLADAGHGPKYFGCGDTLRQLPSLSFASPLGPDGTHDSDPVDLAFLPLDPESARDLPSADSLRAEGLELIPQAPAAADLYLFCGFPASRQPRRVAGNGAVQSFTARPISFLTEEAPQDFYGAGGIDRATHLLVRYDPDDFWSGDVQQRGPELFGVSGGGLWRLPGILSGATVRPQLAAIVTAWHRGDRPAVLATRMAVLLDAVGEHFPEAIAHVRRIWRARPV